MNIKKEILKTQGIRNIWEKKIKDNESFYSNDYIKIKSDTINDKILEDNVHAFYLETSYPTKEIDNLSTTNLLIILDDSFKKTDLNYCKFIAFIENIFEMNNIKKVCNSFLKKKKTDGSYEVQFVFNYFKPSVILVLGKSCVESIFGKQIDIKKVRNKSFKLSGIPTYISFGLSEIEERIELRQDLWEDLIKICNHILY